MELLKRKRNIINIIIKTDQDLIFEAYSKTLNDGMEPEEDESVGDFDEFIGKAEKFVDEIGDDGLEFLANLHKDQFEVLMDVVSDERGYRNQTPTGDYES